MTHAHLDAATVRKAHQGVGLGLSCDFLEEVVDGPALDVAFFEVSPENYMKRGGFYPAALEQISSRYRARVARPDAVARRHRPAAA